MQASQDDALNIDNILRFDIKCTNCRNTSGCA